VSAGVGAARDTAGGVGRAGDDDGLPGRVARGQVDGEQLRAGLVVGVGDGVAGGVDLTPGSAVCSVVWSARADARRRGLDASV
jgi:hypothetical protein